jgi:hypothetical protein
MEKSYWAQYEDMYKKSEMMERYKKDWELLVLEVADLKFQISALTGTPVTGRE